jgi:hypothetical protein
MGEYAKRKSDGQEVKIGTCENMYYLRYEDRAKVAKIPNSLNPAEDDGDGLRFRLPFPDEDHLQPGEYENYNRGERLYKYDPCSFCNGGTSEFYKEKCPHCQGTRKEPYHTEFTDPEAMESPGSFQLSHPSGLLISVPCYHGMKLPDLGKDTRAGWNGKSWFFELYMLRAAKVDGTVQVFPVVRCRHCGEQWRYQWSDIWDYIPADMQARLKVYADAQPEAVSA